MGRQKKRETKVTIYGNNAEDVAGSITGVSYGGETILIDMGLVMSSNKLEMYAANKNALKNIPVKSVTDIILSHGLHADHALGIGTYIANGNKANIHILEGVSAILKLMLNDCARINRSDCDYLSEKYKKEFRPLYNELDVDDVMNYLVEHKYKQKYQLNKYMWFEFIPSGHIYKSAQVMLYIEDGSYKKKIGYLCDLGNPNIKKPLVEDIEYIKSCNLVLAECTYAKTEDKATPKHRKIDIDNLSKQISKTCGENKSTILMATFAMQRSVEMMVALYEVWEKTKFQYPVYLDSPLGINIFKEMHKQSKDEILDKLSNWNNLHFVSDYGETREILNSSSPKIVLASSAFAQGGKILSYFTQVLPNSKSCLITGGYSSPDSNMGLVKKRKPITIMNEGELKEYQVKCEILELTSFSSHMQSPAMMKYYSSIRCEKIVLIHGELTKKLRFAEELQEEYRNNSSTTKVYVMNKNEYITI
jgi:metallo-beta-lactamase family protein